VLRQIQPTTGGFLEATPLTAFVTMSLLACGRRADPVVREGVRFLAASARPDGSWPIDTNLATWVTTLAVNALGDRLPELDRGAVRDWLLAQQYRTRHPYTDAAPGGWAWTDLAGGVPDADDTPGALLALAKLGPPDARTLDAADAGCRWLLGVQNRDGGIPTFCRGWTGLPFDRSSADLTAHTLLAWHAWRDALPELRPALDTATARGLAYLSRIQRPDGAWAPLWFGNQHAAETANLTYGTSRVLRLAALGDHLPAGFRERLAVAAAWLRSAQNPDGGWGGRASTPSTVEETALAVEGLGGDARGLAWLERETAGGTRFPPAPIGFYFANLWYFERLYPVAFTAAAVRSSA
jgi:squalene-hopene/tetraprenyl-beta-curcumene cyclase